MRPLTVDDLDALLELEEAYASRYRLEPTVSLGSANFYARSGHSFTAERGGTVEGFVLAHAIWDGLRPLVRATRVTARPDDWEQVAPALIEALTKSAYDAAVYDVEVLVPSGDDELASALDEKRYRPADWRPYRRTLGSRGAEAP